MCGCNSSCSDGGAGDASENCSGNITIEYGIKHYFLGTLREKDGGSWEGLR